MSKIAHVLSCSPICALKNLHPQLGTQGLILPELAWLDWWGQEEEDAAQKQRQGSLPGENPSSQASKMVTKMSGK